MIGWKLALTKIFATVATATWPNISQAFFTELGVIESENGARMAMTEASVGLKVNRGAEDLEVILLVLESNEKREEQVVSISDGFDELTVSPGHNVFVLRNGDLVQVSAKEVREEDSLLRSNGQAATVKRIKRKTMKTRRYSPVTPSEIICVNGFIVSTKGVLLSETLAVARELGVIASHQLFKLLPARLYSWYGSTIVPVVWNWCEKWLNMKGM